MGSYKKYTDEFKRSSTYRYGHQGAAHAGIEAGRKVNINPGVEA